MAMAARSRRAWCLADWQTDRRIHLHCTRDWLPLQQPLTYLQQQCCNRPVSAVATLAGGGGGCSVRPAYMHACQQRRRRGDTYNRFSSSAQSLAVARLASIRGVCPQQGTAHAGVRCRGCVCCAGIAGKGGVVSQGARSLSASCGRESVGMGRDHRAHVGGCGRTGAACAGSGGQNRRGPACTVCRRTVMQKKGGRGWGNRGGAAAGCQCAQLGRSLFVMQHHRLAFRCLRTQQTQSQRD